MLRSCSTFIRTKLSVTQVLWPLIEGAGLCNVVELKISAGKNF